MAECLVIYYAVRGDVDPFDQADLEGCLQVSDCSKCSFSEMILEGASKVSWFYKGVIIIRIDFGAALLSFIFA